MARPKRYSTDEERKEAKREAVRRYRARKKFQALPENDIMNIGLNILPNQSLQLTHDERVQRLKESDKEKFIDVYKQLSQAQKVLNRILYKYVSKYHKPTNQRKESEEISFHWDDYDEEQQKELFKGVANIMRVIANKSTIDDKWLMKYSFDNNTIKTRKFDIDRAEEFINQLEDEFLDKVSEENALKDYKDYDEFYIEISALTKLDIVYLIPVYKKYNKNEGAFWRWLLKVPINLQRYQIFNTLNDKTIKLMTQDNCIIYACNQYGLGDNIIKHMRDIFKTRYISMTKLKTITDECKIHFSIRHYKGKDNQSTITQIGQQYKTHIKLLLMNNHYMLDELVPISPYYIRHWREINSNPKMKSVPIQKRFIITKYHNGVYESSNDKFDLRDVLNALFDIDAFKPITQSELMTYKSSLYKEKLDDIDTLEYDPKLCCRLKAPPEYLSKKNDIKDDSEDNEFYD